MIQWDGPGWRKAEEGFFFFDIGGAMVAMAAMVAVLAYIGVQLSYMADLEGNITADYLAREQLDILCMEQNLGDLATRQVEANSHSYQVESSRTAGSLANMVHYGVKVSWQDRKGQQEIEIGRDVPVEAASEDAQDEAGA